MQARPLCHNPRRNKQIVKIQPPRNQFKTRKQREALSLSPNPKAQSSRKQSPKKQKAMAENTFHSYYKNNPNNTSSSAASASTSDDISLFLQQILVRSSNSLAHSTGKGQQLPSVAALPDYLHRYGLSKYAGDGITAGDCSGGDVPAGNPNVSSSSFGASENENDEYDCESEEGLEAFAEEAAAKPGSGRSSSKRSRAAEVHNMSEKRRRSRINEKMKALQMLIPNSNKTDKASMLDEAIEYLKQLQLQVQMLSMRNGMSLHPLCLPGELQPAQFSQMRMDLREDNRPAHFNMTSTLQVNQESSMQNRFGLANQCTATNQAYVPDMSNVVNSETPFGLESSIQTHFGPFQLENSSEDICREDFLQHQQINANCSETNPLEFELGATATNSLPFTAQVSDRKGSTSLGACSTGRDRHGAGLLKTIEQNFHIDSMRAGRRFRNDDIKNERRHI